MRKSSKRSSKKKKKKKSKSTYNKKRKGSGLSGVSLPGEESNTGGARKGELADIIHVLVGRVSAAKGLVIHIETVDVTNT